MTEARSTKLETRRHSDSQPGYARLDAWKLSDDLALHLFHLTNKLPARQSWLRSQIMRSAVAVPGNLAGGYSRTSNKEFLQFLSVARGSLAEVEYYLHFLARTQLVDELAATRHQTLRLLSRVRPEHLSAPITMTDGGTCNVTEYISMITEHEAEHAGQLVAASKARRFTTA